MKKNKFFIFTIFIIYFLIVLVTSYYHESWEDESQGWLIARDLNFIEIINQMKYEGHSFLWYYILAIFAKLLPYEFSKIIMIVIAGITGFLILTKSPYNNWVKLLILFNTVFLYYMPVFLRPYSIIPLMLICISIMNENPEKYPVLYGIAIAILANAHIIILGLAFIIYFKFFMEQFVDKYEKNSKKQNIKLIIGTFIAIIGMIIVIGCAISGFLSSIAPTHGTDVPEEALERMFNLALNLHSTLININIPNLLIVIIDIIILVLVVVQSIKTDKKQGIIFFVGLAFYLFVQLLVFGILANQRTVLLFILLLYFSWNTKRISIEKSKTDIIEVVIVIICVLSIPHTIRIISDEIKYPYTDSKNVAEYIKDNIEEGSIFVTINWDTISSAEVYLSDMDYKFYDAQNDSYVTFAVWDKFLDKTKEMDLENAINKFKDSNQNVYFLNLASDTEELNSFKKSKDKLKLIYYTNGECLSRRAYLYEIIK